MAYNNIFIKTNKQLITEGDFFFFFVEKGLDANLESDF